MLHNFLFFSCLCSDVLLSFLWEDFYLKRSGTRMQALCLMQNAAVFESSIAACKYVCGSFDTIHHIVRFRA